ncbi:MAG: peptidase T [Chloroflexi bacterium]|jgi:tripeptide aminopeptidase|nr:peptidase T [Chloroflexota bacterium]
MSDVLERFLRYVKIDTESARDSETYPSTAKQLELLRLLADELRQIGLRDVAMDQYGYVTATLEATTSAPAPVIGFLAHVDTSPDFNGKDVRPQIVENYDGGDIVLNANEKIILSPQRFPDLLKYRGESLVTTDGTSLLGADDKAGIAEIMTSLAYLAAHPEIPHGKVRVAFTPDEEVGAGVDHFDVVAFGADFAFTVDGGEVGELEIETFNAAGAKVIIRGRNVHPGTAKGVMLNALIIAMEYNALLPVFDRPEHTEKSEGFYHLTQMSGGVELAQMDYIIRDHDEQSFEKRKAFLQSAAEFLNRKYGEPVVEVALKDQYYNMKKMIDPHPQILAVARAAYEAVGIEPRVIPVRGGTDGSRLSYMGLPTPNLFAGGHNMHGRYEFVPVSALEKASQVIVKICELAAG